MDTKFYAFIRPIAKGLFYLLYGPKVIGIENVPKNSNFILAGNHTKWLDPVMLVAINKRQIHFLAKDELFKGGLSPFIKGMGCIPVNRKIHDKNALDTAINELNKGLCIGIFPEGTINRTKDLVMPFKYGAVSMANKTKTAIVPFVITGKYKLFKRNITIEFLKPRNISCDLDLENVELMNCISEKIKKYRSEVSKNEK